MCTMPVFVEARSNTGGSLNVTFDPFPLSLLLPSGAVIFLISARMPRCCRAPAFRVATGRATAARSPATDNPWRGGMALLMWFRLSSSLSLSAVFRRRAFWKVTLCYMSTQHPRTFFRVSRRFFKTWGGEIRAPSAKRACAPDLDCLERSGMF